MRGCLVGFENEPASRWLEFIFFETEKTSQDDRQAIAKARQMILITSTYYIPWLRTRYPKLSVFTGNDTLRLALGIIPRITRAPLVVRRYKELPSARIEQEFQLCKDESMVRIQRQLKIWELARDFSIPQEDAAETLADFTVFIDEEHWRLELPLARIIHEVGT